MDSKTRKKLDELLEGFRNNPSNSNKYRHSIYALFENEEALGVVHGFQQLLPIIKPERQSSVKERIKEMYVDLGVFERAGNNE